MELSFTSSKWELNAKLSTTLSRLDLVLVSNDSTIPTNTQQHLLAARTQKEPEIDMVLYCMNFNVLS